MSQKYTVSWVVDVEDEAVNSFAQAASFVAARYFHPRIAFGDVGSACVFEVESQGEKRTVDLADYLMNEKQLQEAYDVEHPRFPRNDWKYDVENDDTTQGYYPWLMSKLATD